MQFLRTMHIHCFSQIPNQSSGISSWPERERRKTKRKSESRLPKACGEEKKTESRSRTKFYNWHLSVFSTNRMWKSDYKARFKTKTLSDEAMLYQFKLVPAFSRWSLPSILWTEVSVERNPFGLSFHFPVKGHCCYLCCSHKPSGRQGLAAAQPKPKKSPFFRKKLWGWSNTGTGCPDGLCSLRLWRCSKPKCTQHWEICCSQPCLSDGLVQVVSINPFPISAVLWAIHHLRLRLFWKWGLYSGFHKKSWF